MLRVSTLPDKGEESLVTTSRDDESNTSSHLLTPHSIHAIMGYRLREGELSTADTDAKRTQPHEP